jgi:hypothetical protein
MGGYRKINKQGDSAMKVLGVAPTSKDFCLALLDRTAESPALIDLEKKKHKFPVDGDEADQMYALKRFVDAIIGENQIDKLTILGAGTSQYRGPSSSRIKAECVFQLAAKERGIQVEVIPPQTFRAREKKFMDITGDSPEITLVQNRFFLWTAFSR